MEIMYLILSIISMLSVNYGTKYFDYWLEKRRKRLSQDDNMDEEYRRSQTVKPLLEDLRSYLGATRVAECAFSNGDTTFGGYHLKKISIMTESDPLDDDELIAPHFQLVPAKKFNRTLEGLYHSNDGCIVWDETEFKDETAALNRAFSFNHIMMVSIRDHHNKWIGYVFISWNKKPDIEDGDIERVKLVASRLGAMSSKP